MLRTPLVLWELENGQILYRLGGNSRANQCGEAEQSRNCKQIFYRNGTRKSDSLLYVHKCMVMSSVYGYENKISAFYNKLLNSIKMYKKNQTSENTLRLGSYKFDSVGIMDAFGPLPGPISLFFFVFFLGWSWHLPWQMHYKIKQNKHTQHQQTNYTKKNNKIK